MATDNADTHFDDIIRDVTSAMRAEGERMAAEIKDRVSVPVERTGGKVIRSKRGEPPRKDSGRLQAEIASDTIEVGDVVSMAVYSPTPYGSTLEDPMERLIMTDWFDRFAEEVLDANVRAVEGG